MPIQFSPYAEILPPSYDFVFKALLTHPDAKPALISIISAIIERKVVNAEIRNNELPTMDTEEKNERLDVNCVLEDGDQIDIEMQGSELEEPVKGKHINLLNKSIYYLTDLHSSQKSKGIKYANLVRTYQATFCSYTVYPQYKEFITRGAMRRENGELISDRINLILIELSKLEDLLTTPPDKLSELEAWSIFLRYAPDTRQNVRVLVNRIIEERGEIAVAGELLIEISQDERERARVRSRRMYETDLMSNLLTAEDRGRDEGIVIGEMRGEARGIAIGKTEGISSAIIAAIQARAPQSVIKSMAKTLGVSNSELQKLMDEYGT